MRMRRSIAALVALGLLLAAFAAQAAAKTVYVKANSVKVYASASTSSKALGTMNFGDAMGLVKKSGSWAKVKNSAGAVGYCKYSALTTKNPSGKAKTYYPKVGGATAYYRTNTSSYALAGYLVNEPVSVVATTTDKKWFRVKLSSGGFAFIQCSRLSKTKVEVPITVYIATNTASAYQSKSTSSKNLGTMSFGETLTRVKTEGSWAQVKNAAGKTGYMKTAWITAKNPNGDAETWYAATAAPVRTMPTTSAKQLVALTQGESVDVVAATADGKWVRAEVDGRYGYVESAKLTDDAPAADDGSGSYNDQYRGTASSTIERVIALAIQQLGKKYVYATEGPNTYDCSGLTTYCFSKVAGISLKRSAYAQGYDTNFKKIENVAGLKRGDIVCFDTNTSDVDISDHVGIYLGGGEFIHASSGAGMVIISPINSGYYNRQFSWGLRILN